MAGIISATSSIKTVRESRTVMPGEETKSQLALHNKTKAQFKKKKYSHHAVLTGPRDSFMLNLTQACISGVLYDKNMQ